MKVRRNDPCPCGSGKKYKRCCLNDNNRPEPHEFIKAAKKAFSKEYCLHPDTSECDGSIVRAHTISRFMLRKIAPDAHVYTFPLWGDYFNQQKRGEEISLIKRGINQVSTFTGFCAYHDKSLFAPIEDTDFELNAQSIFLFTYRSLCNELFRKTALSESSEFNLMHGTKGLEYPVKVSYKLLLGAMKDTSNAGVKDLTNAKAKLDKMLEQKEYQELHYQVFVLDKIPEIVSSFCSTPYCDFHGNNIVGKRLYDFSKTLPFVSTQVLPYKKYGIIIFSWIDDDELVEMFVDSLSKLNLRYVPSAVVRFVLSHSETFAINPDWWELQQENMKSYVSYLCKLLLPGTEFNYRCLVGEEQIVDWEVTKVIRSGN